MNYKQVQRYIRLTELVPDLQKMVDEKQLSFTPAVEISFIRPRHQKYIAVAIEGQASSPSLSQAQKMRELDKEGKLNGDVIDGILSEQKKEVDKVIINSAELEKYFGKYTDDPVEHEVPEEYLTDETFSALLTEAEKYIGYPYVWGCSSPSTSFDCSSYLSWVLNQCGWNVGRLGAQGLYNYFTPTSSPQPGDLVFFVGTYDTPGISHCGLYVGDDWMLHCGDPISYANLNSSYWQSHFYAYGRLP